VKTWACVLDPFGKIAPLDELGDHEAQAIISSPNVEDRHDMRMVEAGDDAGFIQVSLNIFGLSYPFWSGNFDRNGAVKIIIKGEKDLTETALPKPSKDGVTPNFRAMEERERERRVFVRWAYVFS
jgi:hypothetical protein